MGSKRARLRRRHAVREKRLKRRRKWGYFAGRNGLPRGPAPSYLQTARGWVVCRRFGHKEPMVVDGPWRFGTGPVGQVRERKEHCARCGARSVYWTSDLSKRGMEP